MRPRMHKTSWLPASRLVHTSADCAFAAAKPRHCAISEVHDLRDVSDEMTRWRAGQLLTCRNVTLTAAVQTITLASSVFTTCDVGSLAKSTRSLLPHEAAWKTGTLWSYSCRRGLNSSISLLEHHVLRPDVWKRLSRARAIPSSLERIV